VNLTIEAQHVLRESDRSIQWKFISDNLSRHRKEVRKMAQEYKCNACGKTFNSERELQEHAKTCK
jgi:hypothetical protein